MLHLQLLSNIGCIPRCTIYPYSLFLAYIVFCTSYKIIHFKVNTSVVFHNLVPKRYFITPNGKLCTRLAATPRPSLPPALVHHQSVLCSIQFPYSGYSI